jgi:hypothetical protein
VAVDFPGWSGEPPVVFASPLMNRRVGGFHLIVRTHIDCGRHSARRSRGIAALLNLNTACDLKVAGHAASIEHYVQPALGLEARVKLVKQLADSGGEIRHRRASVHDGDRLFRELLDFDGELHGSILAESNCGPPKHRSTQLDHKGIQQEIGALPYSNLGQQADLITERGINLEKTFIFPHALVEIMTAF